MSGRTYRCTGPCGQTYEAPNARGRLPRFCPTCRAEDGRLPLVQPDRAPDSPTGRAVERARVLTFPTAYVPPDLDAPPPPLPAPPEPRRPAPAASPFDEPGDDEPPEQPDQAPELGSHEASLRAELAAGRFEHPAARTMSSVALSLARALDRADPTDIKTLLAAAKELRSILNDIAGRQGVDDAGDDGPFGAVRAEVVNPPTPW